MFNKIFKCGMHENLKFYITTDIPEEKTGNLLPDAYKSYVKYLTNIQLYICIFLCRSVGRVAPTYSPCRKNTSIGILPSGIRYQKKNSYL